jgi:hypothetical protein
MDNANYVNHVIKLAPKKYNSMIAVELKTMGDNITLDDIQKAMKTLYHMNNNKGVIEGKSKMKRNDGDTESALIAKLTKAMKTEGEGTFFGSNFNSKCYKYGKPGHKAYKCQSKSNDNNQKIGTKEEMANTNSMGHVITAEDKDTRQSIVGKIQRTRTKDLKIGRRELITTAEIINMTVKMTVKLET